MKTMAMDQELPRVVQAPHAFTSRKHFTDTPSFSLNVRLLEQETAVDCASGSREQTISEVQSKQDRHRRMQKRRSAQKKRCREREYFLHLHSRNKELRYERDLMKKQILKLKANAGYARSILSTIHEMKLLTSSQRQYPLTLPDPPPQWPPAGLGDDGARANSLPSVTTVSDSIIPVSNQGLTLGSVAQGSLWTGQGVGSVLEFSSLIEQQQLFPEGDPVPSLPPNSVSSGDPGMDQHKITAGFPAVAAMTSTVSDPKSFAPVTYTPSYGVYTMDTSSLLANDGQDLIDFLETFADWPNDISLAENTASTMLKDELRAPIPSPGKDSVGSPGSPSGRCWVWSPKHFT